MCVDIGTHNQWPITLNEEYANHLFLIPNIFFFTLLYESKHLVCFTHCCFHCCFHYCIHNKLGLGEQKEVDRIGKKI